MTCRPLLLFLTLAAAASAQDRTIRLPRDPKISPDGQQVAFAWRGDIWTASTNGGDARRLTTHPADDGAPWWTPDQAAIVFTSSRSGSAQLYRVPIAGGAPTQLTHDSNRKTVHGFGADGAQLLVTMRTDRGFHYSESARLFAVDLTGAQPKRMLLDVGLAQAALSPDGEHLLFVRGRPMWSRKGHRGTQSAQLWYADLRQTPATLRRLDEDQPGFQNIACQNPVWAPDSKTYYYVSDPDGTFDVYQRRLGSEAVRRVTRVGASDRSDDGVAFPSLSKDGGTMLVRRRFDLMKVDTKTGATQAIALRASGDDHAVAIERRVETSAENVAFTADGKQVAFVAGEDVWVMDRILKEPRRVTNTPHNETSLAFSEDGARLFYVSDVGGEFDIWEATHDREDGIWWLCDEFTLRQVTDDRAVEGNLRRSPAGDHVAYTKQSDIFVMDGDGTDHRKVVDAWSMPQFDWSPDGRWLTYATQDSDYNSDVWIVSLDGTQPAYNLSRHPDYDGNPAWSGDGKRLAFTSRRDGEESDVYYVNLTADTEEQTNRDRTLEKALAAMKSGDAKKNKKQAGEESEDAGARVVVDLDGIHDRLHRISIRDSREGGLIWSPDGKTLAFSATVSSQSGFYGVTFPNPGAPKKLAARGLSRATWQAAGNEVVGLSSGKPAALKNGSSLSTFAFSVRRIRDWSAVRQIAFDQGWRAMRDRFYDPDMNNRDWDAVRRKYRPVAAQCLGQREFTDLMNMMLGELNASHMGHRGGSDALPSAASRSAWSPTTYHLGLRFAQDRPTEGVRVESVIPGSPCDQGRSKVRAGETLLAIDGVEITPTTDLDALLTMDQERDVDLTVLGADSSERTFAARPTRSVSGLLYDEFVEANRARVDALSDGKLGYLHIQGMNMRSFRQMEEDLYHAGAGKQGLIIDVRFNGGGSTTDHVMTALTQPVHAITKSRGSGEGYPQDRKIYASWTKPIVLMCNEHSFSNAEILSHAVQQVGRGRLVGMRTAGGVISTGSVSLLDGSSVRMPMRGWYLASTGEDMELNGCTPDISLWNDPMGPDAQLVRAVEALQEDVAAAQAKGKVKIVPAATKRRTARQAAERGGR
ncbi:MAG: S41 family peptidase [Planctomycetota bacterium]